MGTRPQCPRSKREHGGLHRAHEDASVVGGTFRFRFGYVMGLISISIGDLPPSLARKVWLCTFFFWVGFDADPNGTFRNMPRFPIYARSA